MYWTWPGDTPAGAAHAAYNVSENRLMPSSRPAAPANQCNSWIETLHDCTGHVVNSFISGYQRLKKSWPLPALAAAAHTQLVAYSRALQDQQL
jgi:hypothetical protein